MEWIEFARSYLTLLATGMAIASLVFYLPRLFD